MKKQKEIEETIEKLKSLRKVLPERSMFGDNNHEKIDEQIDFLQYVLMDVKSGIRKEYEAGILCEFPEGPIQRARLEACDWVMDYTDEPLVYETDIKTFRKNKG